MSSDLSRPKPVVDPRARERVRGWVLEAFGLPEDGFVRVTQVTCSEPGCPPIETAITTDYEGGVTVRMIRKATAEISREDVLALARPKEAEHE